MYFNYEDSKIDQVVNSTLYRIHREGLIDKITVGIQNIYDDARAHGVNYVETCQALIAKNKVEFFWNLHKKWKVKTFDEIGQHILDAYRFYFPQGPLKNNTDPYFLGIRSIHLSTNWINIFQEAVLDHLSPKMKRAFNDVIICQIQW